MRTPSRADGQQRRTHRSVLARHQRRAALRRRLHPGRTRARSHSIVHTRILPPRGGRGARGNRTFSRKARLRRAAWRTTLRSRRRRPSSRRPGRPPRPMCRARRGPASHGRASRWYALTSALAAVLALRGWLPRPAASDVPGAGRDASPSPSAQERPGRSCTKFLMPSAQDAIATKKTILDNTLGYADGGSILSLMGPSGSGAHFPFHCFFSSAFVCADVPLQQLALRSRKARSARSASAGCTCCP